jgi:hypothetical protein
LADQGLHGFFVILLAAALRDEALHLASAYAESGFQHIGRELAPLGADMELEALIAGAIGFFQWLHDGEDDEDDRG